MTAVARKALDAATLPLRGIHLVEASAGTGKTYTITSLVLRLIVEGGVPIEKILVVTFTNAATAELRHRIEARIRAAHAAFSASKDGPAETDDAIVARLLSGSDRAARQLLLERALHALDRAPIHTIHGFAHRALTEAAFESRSRIGFELTGDQDSLIVDAVADFWANSVATLPREEFMRIGGFELRARLFRAGREATKGNYPVVPLRSREELQRTQVQLRAEYDAAFHAARALFAEKGAEIAERLRGPELKRNIFRLESLAPDMATLAGWLESGHWYEPLPDVVAKYTATKIRNSLKKDKTLEHPAFEALERVVLAHEALRANSAWEAAWLLHACVDSVRARLDVEHGRARTQSFDGILLSLARALREDSGAQLSIRLRQQLSVALIDEFQDTDPVQYDIFRAIFAEARTPRLFLIGDPKQSIYAFRGADVLAYLRAGREASGGVWTQNVSYRGSPAVVASQNAVFGDRASPFLLPEISYELISAAPNRTNELTDAGGRELPGMEIVLPSEEEKRNVWELTADLLVEALSGAKVLAGKPVLPGDFAVLCRKNDEAAELHRVLRGRGVPAVLHGDRSVFESEEAQELWSFLAALLEPADRRAVRRALATRLGGLNSADFAELESDGRKLELWDARLRGWGNLWRQAGVFRALSAAARELRWLETSLGRPGGERLLTNVKHLMELLHEAEAELRLGMVGLFRFLEAAMANPMGHAMAQESMQIRLENDEKAVLLTTMHRSKGLEFPIVLLPTMSGKGYPLFAPFRTHQGGGESVLEVRDRSIAPESYERAAFDERAEQLRLGYVALTRARHQTIVIGPEKLKEASGSTMFELLFCDGAGASGLGAAGPAASLFALAQRSSGSIVVRRDQGSSQPAQPLPAAPLRRALLEPVLPTGLSERLGRGTKTSSFSALVRRLPGAPDAEGRDVDGSVSPPLRSDDAAATPSEAVTRALDGFPRGAEAGEALHRALELCPFAPGEAEARKLLVQRVFAEQGIPEAAWGAGVLGLEQALSAPLGPLSVSLSEISVGSRVPERGFHLPAGALESPLDPGRLAGCLLDAAIPREAATAAGRLTFSEWHGFLRGFIDLCFEQDGRYYIADYKSNDLGSVRDAYDKPSLVASMVEHHYYLQALIYAFALHRFLGLRIPGYSYEQHFGGVFYLYLRGMTPEHPGSGVLHFRPEEATMKRLASILDAQ